MDFRNQIFRIFELHTIFDLNLFFRPSISKFYFRTKLIYVAQFVAPANTWDSVDYTGLVLCCASVDLFC